MDWSNEFYVRLYVRDTTSWRRLGWDGQCVLMQMLRKVDRAGTIELDGIEPWEAVVLHCSAPQEQAQRGMESLLRVGVMEVRGDLLVFPNFIEAQEAIKSDKLRAKASRMKKAEGESRGVTKTSRGVTPESRESDTRHDASRAVTPRHAASLLTPLRFASLHCASLPAEPQVSEPELTNVAADLAAENSQSEPPAVQPQKATTGLGQQLFEAYRAASFARNLTPESAGQDQKVRIAQRVCDHAHLRKIPLKAACDEVIAQAFDDAAATNGKVVMALEFAQPGQPKRAYGSGPPPPPERPISSYSVGIMTEVNRRRANGEIF